MVRAERLATKLVERVLLYLERRLQAAELRNRRQDSHAYEAAWLLVFERYYGAMPRPLLQVIPPAVDSLPNSNRDKPWFRAKYAKPMRRVDRNIEHTVPAHDGYGVTTWFDQVLECGHVIELCFDLPDTERPRHRRCAECAGEEQEFTHGSSQRDTDIAQRRVLSASQLLVVRRNGLPRRAEALSVAGHRAAGALAVVGGVHRAAPATTTAEGGPIGAA